MPTMARTRRGPTFLHVILSEQPMGTSTMWNSSSAAEFYLHMISASLSSLQSSSLFTTSIPNDRQDLIISLLKVSHVIFDYQDYLGYHSHGLSKS
jgi:hypothetical protein